MGTTRYVYNKALSAVKEGEKLNFYSLRDKFVTSKGNTDMKEWELETPKDIRAGAIRDMAKGFKVALENLKRGNITNFNLRYRKKREDKSLEIPARSIKLQGRSFYLFSTYLNTPIKVAKDKYWDDIRVDYDCRLQFQNNNWYINIPVNTINKIKNPPHEFCSLDPGVRKFQTVYSEQGIFNFKMNKDIARKLYFKMDKLRSLRDRKIIKSSSYNKRRKKLRFKIDCLVADFHHKTASFLTDNFRNIFLPKFESQKLSQKIRSSKTNRDLLSLKHYQFRQRLLFKCKTNENCYTVICTEEYTSKTCTSCGSLNDVGDSEIYKCGKCKLDIDRDVNGARNILIKNVNELFSLQKKAYNNLS